MHIEIENRAPIQVTPAGDHAPLGKRATTRLIFPDGTGLPEAIQTVEHVLPWHCEGAAISAIKSDDIPLARYLSDFYGVKKPDEALEVGLLGTMGTLAMVGLLMAATRMALRYNNGASWQAALMGNPSSTGTGTYAPGIYLALSSDSTAPASTDTSLVGEITSGTLSRAQATFGYTAGATSYTQSKIFTSDQTVTIYKDGLFNVSSGGSPLFGSLLTQGGVPTPTALYSGSQVGITESISF